MHESVAVTQKARRKPTNEEVHLDENIHFDRDMKQKWLEEILWKWVQ